MKPILKLGLILGIITSICVGLLGAINSITTPIIAEQKEESQQLAMKQILSNVDAFETIEIDETTQVLELFKGIQNGKYVGAVAKVAPEGYGGAVEVLVGVDMNNTVVGIEILSHTETPGLGANIAKDAFKEQYKGKTAPLHTVKGISGDNEISAITGATITTKAVTEGVNMAVETIATYQEKWIEEEENE